MPQLPLASALLRSLPWLSAQGRAAINLLVCDNGRVASANSLASSLGLRNRYQLARLLRSEGLPRYDVLTGWVSLLYWRLEAERTPSTLVELAQRSHVAPETSYRLVRRITGSHWSDIKDAPAQDILSRFVEQCGRHSGPRKLAWRQPSRTNADSRSRPGPSSTSPSVRVPLSGAPISLATHAGEIYIARGRAASIERLDVAAKRFVGTIAVGCGPSCIAVDPRRARIYASLQYEDAIAVIDRSTYRVVGTIAVPGDPYPVLVSQDGDRLYTTTNEDRLHAVALPSGRIVASLPLPATSHFLTLHPAGHHVYVATRAAGTVLEVDAKSLRVQREFVLGGETLDLHVTGDGRFLFVANGRRGLQMLRLTDGRLLRTVEFDRRPVHMAVSPDEQTIYVSQVEGGAVAVVDRASFTVRFLPTGGRPRGMVLGQGGKLLIVANEAGWVDLLPV